MTRTSVCQFIYVFSDRRQYKVKDTEGHCLRVMFDIAKIVLFISTQLSYSATSFI